MGLLRFLKTIATDPLLLCLLLICAVFSAISVLQYFRAIRPRRGTTEWMQKVDVRSFGPLRLYKPAAADVIWAFLTVLCVFAICFSVWGFTGCPGQCSSFWLHGASSSSGYF